jgi:Arabinose efflux permease
MQPAKERRSQPVWFALAVLFAINTLNFFDRLVIGAVGEPIRKEFGLGDASLGLLSTAFVLVYAVVGIPFGRLADRFSRVKILSAGVFAWSFFTVATGFARAYWQIFILRIGVGVGEASCAPAATSLISDIFPAEKRARAMSIFMLGLPIGIALSFLVSGTIAQEYGWRTAFIVAGLPGIILSVVVLFVYEPRSKEITTAPAKRAPHREVLSSPTMRWLILSGVIHNFCLYALSTFMTPYLMRFHGLDIRDASVIAMLVNGIFTLPGLLLGGVLGDWIKLRYAKGGLLLVAGATLLSIPLFAVAVTAERGDTSVFLWAMGLAFALMYFYYSITYATIADLTPAENRGTAMSVYFLAMYILGGALGPYALGSLSDYFTRKAATASGLIEYTTATLEPFRASGLQSAMYIVPVLCVILAFVLLAASRTVTKEIERLMRDSTRSD